MLKYDIEIHYVNTHKRKDGFIYTTFSTPDDYNEADIVNRALECKGNVAKKIKFVRVRENHAEVEINNKV